MNLEDYFDFLSPDDIRLKGTRVGIETVLDEYLYQSRSPEQIDRAYSSLTLEQIYATILYYLHNRKAVSQYLERWQEYCQQSMAEFDRNPPPAVKRLLRYKAAQKTASKVQL